METLKFYQIEKPTTKQIFDAILNKEYVPIEKMQSKAKQIKVLLLNYWNANEILITLTNITNSGGYPLFYCDKDSIYDIANDDDVNFWELSEEEQDEQIELLASYTQTYNQIFNLKS
jgi:hypothetical protein